MTIDERVDTAVRVAMEALGVSPALRPDTADALRDAIAKISDGIVTDDEDEAGPREGPDVDPLTIDNSILVRFVPQVWVNDHSMQTDDGLPEFRVAHHEVIELTGIPLDAFDRLEDEPYARDALHRASTAPAWVRDWAGPFEVELVEE